MNRILIVDDKQENLYLLRFLLEGNGYEVDEARHGAEALLKARQSPPRLVISDLLMPVMDGYTLLRHWKLDERLKEIPFVVYTATYTEPKDEKLALDLGADAFIIKPTEPEPFMNRLQDVLAKQQDGFLSPPKLPSGDEQGQIKQYNEALIRKLEEKALQLEQANRALELDIAERQKAEAALRESEALLNEVGQIAKIGGWEMDMITRKARWTRGTYDIVEIEPGAPIPGPDEHVRYYLPEYRPMVAEAIRGLIKEDKPLDIEAQALTAKGNVKWFHAIGKAVRNGNQCIKIKGTLQDITEQKLAETEREKLQAQLIQAQKMESVGRLAGGVAHDFNNMLGIILGYSELILERGNLSETLQNNIQEIHNAGRRAAEITRKLLAFARRQTISPQVLDLNETVGNMLKMLRRLIGEDIDLAWLPKSGLWPVMADPSQIDQILANLCVNARDAIAGTGKVTIETGMMTFDEAYCSEHAGFVPGNYTMLAVSDNGCGMPREVLSHLFEPFFTTKEVGKGTGLGLATVYGIVKQNNGFINVYSEPERGTTVKIYLPRHVGEADTILEQEAVVIPRGNGENVLVVEDDAAILILAETMLTCLGYKVLEASDPNLALQLAREHLGTIKLLLTDVVMPEMNGRDLARQVQALDPEIKVLFMSGYTADTVAHHGVLDEGIRFLQKPFSIKDIANKVQQALDEK
jgi:two-component system, cell cycle sensor histidine kinase and response regulator CckA